MSENNPGVISVTNFRDGELNKDPVLVLNFRTLSTKEEHKVYVLLEKFLTFLKNTENRTYPIEHDKSVWYVTHPEIKYSLFGPAVEELIVDLSLFEDLLVRSHNMVRQVTAFFVVAGINKIFDQNISPLAVQDEEQIDRAREIFLILDSSSENSSSSSPTSMMSRPTVEEEEEEIERESEREVERELEQELEREAQEEKEKEENKRKRRDRPYSSKEERGEVSDFPSRKHRFIPKQEEHKESDIEEENKERKRRTRPTASREEEEEAHDIPSRKHRSLPKQRQRMEEEIEEGDEHRGVDRRRADRSPRQHKRTRNVPLRSSSSKRYRRFDSEREKDTDHDDDKFEYMEEEEDSDQDSILESE